MLKKAIFCFVIAVIVLNVVASHKKINFPKGNPNCPSTGCAAVLCLSEEALNCGELGTGLEQCGCCPVCLKKEGALCAGSFNQHGNCAVGLTCVDKVFSEIPVENRGLTTPVGQCNGFEVHHTKCFVLCPITCHDVNCKFGVGPNPCSCCSQCFKGPNEKCGGPDNNERSCASGLACLSGGKVVPNDGGPGTPVGRCKYTKY